MHMKSLEVYLGGHFEIITDHEPLAHLFSNAQSRMPLWILRWSLRLKKLDFTISHIKGTANPADFLSWHPFDIQNENWQYHGTICELCSTSYLHRSHFITGDSR